MDERISWKKKYQELELATQEFRAMFIELTACRAPRASQEHQDFLEAAKITERKINELIGTNAKFINTLVFEDEE